MPVDLENALDTMCNYCGEPFEIEDDFDDDGHPVQVVNVPVECGKGKFCSEAHRAQAMYEAQDEAGRRTLRRLYLGAQLMLEHRREALEIVGDWDEDTDLADINEIASCLSPEGGIGGKEGAEDDCEALLLPEAARKVIWDGLYEGRRAAALEVMRANQIAGASEYKDGEVARAKAKLAEAVAALRALEGLRSVVD
jgi:hypothetical protein